VDAGGSKLVGKELHHIKMEIVDSSVTRPLQGIAFGQDSYFRLFKEKHPIDICYNIEENTHGNNIFTQLMVKDMRLSE